MNTELLTMCNIQETQGDLGHHFQEGQCQVETLVTKTAFVPSDVSMTNPLGLQSSIEFIPEGRDQCCRMGVEREDEGLMQSCFIRETEENVLYDYDIESDTCYKTFTLLEVFFLEDASTEAHFERQTDHKPPVNNDECCRVGW